jgi:hypothetical protein
MAKFIVKETFQCVRLYQPDVEGGTYDLADSEMALLIEKGMTHHLQPADDAAKELKPTVDEMTRGDLRALADAKGIPYGLDLEQLRAAVRPKTGSAVKQEAKELRTMTLKEVQQLVLEKGIDAEALAKRMGVENPDKLTKKQLIEAIQAAD